MAEVSNDDTINVVTVTATLVKSQLPMIPSFYDECINNLELSLAHDQNSFRKLKADMNNNVDNSATYINVCNHQKLMILTRCISSVQLLLSRFYRIRFNESISASRSFLWDDNLQQGCVKSTFHGLGLPFIYCPLLPSFAGNLCCSCYNTFNSTDGNYPLPLCTKCVGTYNGPHLAQITNEYKAYEKHMIVMQHNLRSGSDSDSDSNFTTTAEEHSDNRNVDSDNESRTTSDNNDDDSVALFFSFVYDLNVDMYNNEDVHESDVVDTGTHYFTSLHLQWIRCRRRMEIIMERKVQLNMRISVGLLKSLTLITLMFLFIVIVALQNLFVLIVIVMIVIVTMRLCLLKMKMQR